MSTTRIKEYVVDLTKIEGTGDFLCPNCGIRINPEDESETNYSILKTIVKANRLEELILNCNRCLCKIHLMGFLSLDLE